MRTTNLSQLLFALAMIGIGILGFVQGKFTPIWYGPPREFPARDWLAYLCALVSLTSGVGLLWERTSLRAAAGLLLYLLLWMVLFRMVHTVLAPAELPAWWSCGESAVMVGAAWALYAERAGERTGPLAFGGGTRGLRIARVFYGLGLVPFGIAHFVFLQETVVLVPNWLPWHTAWAYATGAAFIVAGIAIVIGVWARLAAVLSTVQMALFTTIVWIPMVLAGTPNAFQWGEFVDSCVLTVAGWVVAASWRRGL